jgi:uncharacterized repeat protein (TIGR01451 family)
MQNSLWKLGALLGVIGAGFLVLLKAQNEMTDRQPPDEAFNELTAIEDLEGLDPARTVGQATPASDADGFSAAPSQPVGVTASGSPEPQPTPAVDRSAASMAASEDAGNEDSNPFGEVAADPPAAGQVEPTLARQTEPPSGNWEGATEADLASVAAATNTPDETLADDQPTAGDQTLNSFGELVESFTQRSDAGQAQQQSGTESDAEIDTVPILPVLAEVRAPGAEPAEIESASASATGGATGMLTAAVDAFNPFVADEPPDESGIPPQPEAAPAAAVDAEAAAAPSPTAMPFEPTSLTALPAADEGPALMAPPVDPAEDIFPQQVEPAAFESDAGVGEAGTQIAQVSGEQPAGGANDPNPFLVFPGVDEPETPQATQQQRPQQPQPLADSATAEPMFPGSGAQRSGRAWVGDTARIEVPPEVQREPRLSPPPQIEAPPQIEPAPRGDVARSPNADRRAAAERTSGDNRVVLPDGTVEMTIMPRNGQPQTARVQQDQPGGFNPFATDADQVDSPPSGVGRDSGRLDAPPTRESTASQPQFPDAGLSFSKGPIQPSAAEMSEAAASQADNGLTSADFVGVGTISPDTPSTPQQAQLTIEKQAPPDAALGQELIYSILVRNVGRSDARNVVVEDLVPKGTELQGTDPQAHMTPEKKLVWKLGAMAPGASRTIRVKVIPREAGQIGSVATVSFEAAVASRTVITAPQLQLGLNGPQEVRIGEKAPFVFTLTNSGSADASNVYIRNIIPAGFEHPAAQQRNGVTDIEYEVGMLRKGESREVELTLLAVGEGDYQNHATLSADGNVNVEAHQAVRVISSRLKVHREGPANRVVGSQARFTNTVTNESGRPLEAVTVSETIPAGVKFVQASDSGYYDPQQRQITWQIDTLEPGGVRQLQTIVLAEQAGELDSTVTAVDQRGDQAEATSRLNVAGYSSLTVDVANPARAIPVGEEVALRLKVRNGGTAAANSVETRVKLPPELKFVSARGPVRYAQQGEWIAFEPIERIDIQAEQTFDIVLTGTAESQDARVVVQLTSAELSRPLSEDESIVIYAE